MEPRAKRAYETSGGVAVVGLLFAVFGSLQGSLRFANAGILMALLGLGTCVLTLIWETAFAKRGRVAQSRPRSVDEHLAQIINRVEAWRLERDRRKRLRHPTGRPAA